MKIFSMTHAINLAIFPIIGQKRFGCITTDGRQRSFYNGPRSGSAASRSESWSTRSCNSYAGGLHNDGLSGMSRK